MDARQYADATQRNREPILEVLKNWLAPSSNILEIASGTGEHAVFFAQYFTSCHWIPSDPQPTARASITAWKQHLQVENLALPLDIDVTQTSWHDSVAPKKINVIVNINMIHISPWSACVGLIKGAKEILSSGGILYLYGPYKREGQHTAESNARFDLTLRDRNPQWGIRDLEAVVDIAQEHNFQLQQVIEMPANNLSVIFTCQ